MTKATKKEEQEAFDNMPESLQQAERGQVMEEALDQLDNAISALDEVEAGIEAALGS